MADTSKIEVEPSTNPIQRKLNKILDTRLDSDKEITEALKALSVFFNENTLRSRRELRSDIERRSLDINRQFVDAFKSVKDELVKVTDDVNQMATTCDNMCVRLHAVKSQTHELITNTTSLQSKGRQTMLKLDVANEFLKKFTLTDEENEVLRGTGTNDHHLKPEFFLALKRVQNIHNEVRILLRTNQQTAGLEIMESMAINQENAFERLYRWTQNQCRQLTGEVVEPSDLLLNAMSALYIRPVLFNYSLDAYTQARRQAVSRMFIDALTQGIGSRPIEMHSHDPLRYTGDMLAFLHQSAANEREQLQLLLQSCPQQEVMKSVGFEALTNIMLGLCRPFRVRVEQVLVGGLGGQVSVPSRKISNQMTKTTSGNDTNGIVETGNSGSINSNPILLYKMSNLLKFYNITILQSLGQVSKNCQFIETLDELSQLCRKMFMNSLSFFASKILDKVEVPGPDLSPTEATFHTLQLLRDILSTQAPSKSIILNKNTIVNKNINKTTAGSMDSSELENVVKALSDPLLQMCAMSASQLPPADMAAYMVNCLHAIHSVISLFPFTSRQVEMLSLQIEAHSDTLVSEQAVSILKCGGIAEIYQIVNDPGTRPASSPLSSVPGCERENVKNCLERFETFLNSTDANTLQQVQLVQSPTIRENTISRARKMAADAYKSIYQAILDPRNIYSDPHTLGLRPPEQVYELLA